MSSHSCGLQLQVRYPIVSTYGIYVLRSTYGVHTIYVHRIVPSHLWGWSTSHVQFLIVLTNYLHRFVTNHGRFQIVHTIYVHRPTKELQGSSYLLHQAGFVDSHPWPNISRDMRCTSVTLDLSVNLSCLFDRTSEGVHPARSGIQLNLPVCQLASSSNYQNPILIISQSQQRFVNNDNSKLY